MDAVTTEQPPPPPPPPPAPARRLTRSRRDRVLGGVAGGLGHYLGVDPVLVRIGFVIACFFGGTGLFVYAAMWALLPERDAAAPFQRYLEQHDRGDLAFWAGVGALALAALIVAEKTGLFATGWGWPLLLIGVGVALWNVGGRPPSPPGPTAGSEAVPTSGGTVSSTVAAASGGPTDPDTSPADPVADAAQPPDAEPVAPDAADQPASSRRHRHRRHVCRRRRRRSHLGRVTVGAMLIAVGVAVLAGLHAGTVAAVALGTVGAGLLVGAWFGRSRALILLGLLLVPVTFATNAFGDLPSGWGRGGVGERVVHVSDPSRLADVYELGAGRLVLDLRDLRVETSDTVHVPVRAGAAEVQVLLPPDVGYRIDASVRAGDIELPHGVHQSGVRRSASVTRHGTGGTVVLRIEVGVGAIAVLQDGEGRA